MKILVLGSGLLGVSTAYELGKRGHDVTVLDRQASSGAETSFANGGQLSYSHAEPWASPHVLTKLPKWMLDSSSPIVFRPRPDMMRWGLSFLRNCTSARARINCINILRLGLYSREKFSEIRRDTNVAFDYNDRGILHIYTAEKDFDHAKHQNDFQAKFGCKQRILTRDETLAMEPTLAHTPRNIVGGIHAMQDECGDAYMYCNALAKVASERYNVKFQYGATIKKLRTENGRIVSAETDQGDFEADLFVMAMGSFSPLLLKPIGIHLPIYPMKGYSITIPADTFSPQVSLTDGTYKVVYSRLGNRLRVAGTAEFAGHNMSINKKRIDAILKAVRTLLPKVNWDQNIAQWGCLRPSTPDGPPIMGATPYANLFLNTGHGTLGWTQAAGSASIVSDLIEGKPPGILLSGLTMERYL